MVLVEITLYTFICLRHFYVLLTLFISAIFLFAKELKSNLLLLKCKSNCNKIPLKKVTCNCNKLLLPLSDL